MSRKLVTFHLTAAETAALKALAGGNQSAYLRALIRRDAAERGVDWPDDALRDTRGQYPRFADDQLGARLSGVYIDVADCRARVARAGEWARNWATLEDEALAAVARQGGHATLSGAYECPPDLAARAKF